MPKDLFFQKSFRNFANEIIFDAKGNLEFWLSKARVLLFFVLY